MVNAAHAATGVRVRKLLVTLDELLPRPPLTARRPPGRAGPA
ncbi:hypothetical protein [Modestobacter sp. SYSU DS0657]